MQAVRGSRQATAAARARTAAQGADRAGGQRPTWQLVQHGPCGLLEERQPRRVCQLWNGLLGAGQVCERPDDVGQQGRCWAADGLGSVHWHALEGGEVGRPPAQARPELGGCAHWAPLDRLGILPCRAGPRTRMLRAMLKARVSLELLSRGCIAP